MVERIMEGMHKLVRRVATAAGRVRRWWLHYDRRFGWSWRVLNLLAAVIIVVEVVAPLVTQLVQSGRYRLDDDTFSLIGQVNPKLANNLKFDSKTKTYRFNPEGERQDKNGLPSQIKTHVGASPKADDNLYSVDLPEDLSKGVTYSDSSTHLGFTMVPHFESLKGKLKQGRLVYPLGIGQAIYTLKANGVKEDIVIRKAVKGELRYSYQLKLPKTLEARMIPELGAIGIYSADPALFGDISYSTDTDRANVAKAQEKSSKTFLVFGLPAPVIKGLDGDSVPGSKAHFELKNNTLTVVASGLGGIKTPVTLDPSIVVTSSSDFATNGNNEGNIDFPTDQIKRGALSGAGVSGGWTAATNALGTARYQHSAVAYNGKLYVLGGNDGSARNDVVYASFSSGDVGSWASTTSFNTARYGHTSVVYNGKLYVIGGYNGSTYYNDVQYAPINSDGTVGGWTTAATTFTTARYLHASAVYKDYLYVVGGTDGTKRSDVQYAPLKASGDLGSWSSTTSFTTARSQHSAVAYNGYMYLLGGDTGSAANDVQYAPINSVGTVGAWATTTSFTTARYGHASVVYNGYLYVIGGYNGSTYYNTIQYAPIYTNGTVGGWTSSSTFTTARNGHASVAYGGYLYVIGGTNGSAQSSIYYAAINSAGRPGDYASTSSVPAGLRGAAYAAGNGYLYVVGGYNGSALVNTIYYAAVNADGSLGSWGTSSLNLQQNTAYIGAVVYRNWLFVSGGCTVSFASCTAITNGRRVTIDTSNGSISSGSWTTVTFSGVALYGHKMLNYGDHIYFLGGVDGSGTYLTTIASEAISSSGGLSGYTTTNIGQLSTGRAFFDATIYDDFIYIAGGYDGTNYKGDVLYSQVTNYTTPTTGSWTSASNTFSNARRGLIVGAERGYLYIAGGYDGSTYYSDTQYAEINDDGSLDAWTTASSFSNGRYEQGGTAYMGNLYVFGGYDGSTYYSDAQYAPINNGGGGAAASWSSTGSNVFTNARYGHTTLAYNGFLYVLGGYNGTTYYNDTQYAALGTDGSVGAWADATPGADFTSTRYQHASVISNGYMYVIGGGNGNTMYNTVQYALICTGSNNGVGGCGSTAGQIGTWVTDGGTSFTTGRRLLAAATYNGYLYISGGEIPNNPNPTPQGDIQYALICTGSNNDVGGCGSTAGEVGTWNTETGSFTTARSSHAMLINNGYMYIIGGLSGGSINKDIQYALICTGSNNGTGGCASTVGEVGTWNTSPTPLQNLPKYQFSALASDGFLYIFGGVMTGGTAQNEVSYAPFKSNGEIGGWETTRVFSTARYQAGFAKYNGYVYLTGGFDGTTPQTSIQYSPVQSISRVSSYSKLVAIGTTVTATGVTNNPALPLDGQSSITYKIADSSGTLSSTGGTCMSSSATIGGYVYVTITLDDTNYSVYPDSNGTQANITDFTISYNAVHPAPNIRLHLGKTLQTGTLSPLDTCGL